MSGTDRSGSVAVQPVLEGTVEQWPTAPEGGFTRVLLKLSGEAFAGNGGLGVDPDVVRSIAEQIAHVVETGVEVAVVIGGGNYFRGAELSEHGMERARADYMGMLGTVMNCLALQDFCEGEAGNIDLEQDLTLAWLRYRQVFELQDLRSTLFVKANDLHMHISPLSIHGYVPGLSSLREAGCHRQALRDRTALPVERSLRAYIGRIPKTAISMALRRTGFRAASPYPYLTANLVRR